MPFVAPWLNVNPVSTTLDAMQSGSNVGLRQRQMQDEEQQQQLANRVQQQQMMAAQALQRNRLMQVNQILASRQQQQEAADMLRAAQIGQTGDYQQGQIAAKADAAKNLQDWRNERVPIQQQLADAATERSDKYKTGGSTPRFSIGTKGELLMSGLQSDDPVIPAAKALMQPTVTTNTPPDTRGIFGKMFNNAPSPVVSTNESSLSFPEAYLRASQSPASQTATAPAADALKSPQNPGLDETVANLQKLGMIPATPVGQQQQPAASGDNQQNYKTADEVKADYKSGKLNKDAAKKILQSLFGMQ